jgi:hypothetical protein
MIAFVFFVLAVLASPFKSKSRLEAENAVLRHHRLAAQGEGSGSAYQQRPLAPRHPRTGLRAADQVSAMFCHGDGFTSAVASPAMQAIH